MERREYLLGELPAELRPHYDAMGFDVPMASVGLTLDGIRYRIYRDEKAREKFKPIYDVLDALKGADVPVSEIEATLDKSPNLRVVRVEAQKETRTTQEQFTFDVGKALGHVFEELESTCESVNRDFAWEVKQAASKHGLSKEQIGRVLADFAGNMADISTGPSRRVPWLKVVDVLLSGYETLLGKDETNRIRAYIENEETEGWQ